MLLGIETSCDETSAAVLKDGREVLGHVILSQDAHNVFGGVVPEVAARAHLKVLDRVVSRTLQEAGTSLGQLEGIGVTAGPGLIGALLVGVCWAKAVARALDVPLVGVHHMEAHLFAPSLEDPRAEPPFVALLVSGGHTLLLHVPEWGRYRLLGETRDDAAGEAFDKAARLLGLPYPGGPAIQGVAEGGDPTRYTLPRPMLRSGQGPQERGYLDFSFSGLKTALLLQVEEVTARGELEAEVPHLAASFQQAVVDVLVGKTLRAVETTGCSRVLLGGGVSANGPLREALARELSDQGQLFHSSPRLAVDNGAMVARAAWFRLSRGERAGPELNAMASLPFPGLVRT
ncbi:MAG: tRNA (adenosine(37)-N6)-threonylcarbamoyltransferase complex transferase subunit TsaD [Gemmatimonadota bacterium]